MLNDEEWKEVLKLDKFTSLDEEIDSYIRELRRERAREIGIEEGIEIGIEEGIEIGRKEGREIGRKEYMNELTSKLKKLLRAGKSLTDPECLQVLGLTQDDLKSTPTQKIK